VHERKQQQQQQKKKKKKRRHSSCSVAVAEISPRFAEGKSVKKAQTTRKKKRTTPLTLGSLS
jgi:hypothetical protein